ncbi:MAG: tRNA (adenosine(37)-N6)-dimethylallyltransferase MiaA [Dehalococcoidia bacterium]|nr:tRNA (adenosine(37)-N6)-dimethylallyltransferase MiaA [Dehalococcoidia bacterium]MCB9485994.1 tRNA (adenosine(37)-N6)-dimethylallyltransferase MiaA [Thermoflexaceae bacterium]
MNRAVVIAGPTASGKSAAAIDFALRFGGEIINADSRQVYSGMRIGTAAPDVEQLARVPHHLFGFLHPSENYSLALYQRQARTALDECWKRGVLPIVVGGTGQYIWGLLEAWTVPPVEANGPLRQQLRARAEAEGVVALHETLAQVDPLAASRIDPANVRRVIRALEVFELTGKRISEWQEKRDPGFEFRVFGLDVPLTELDARIDRRVDLMVADGLVEEVRSLLKAGVRRDANAMDSIGYREILVFLDGELDLSEAVGAIKQSTRQLARGQKKWFRAGDPRITWVRDSAELLDAAKVFIGGP